MLIFKHHSETVKSFKKYLKKEGRIAFELREIHELLKLAPTLTPIHSQLHQIHTVQATFKILIFINRLLIQKTIPIDQISVVLANLIFKTNSQFQEQLVSKLIVPYQLYLQRRTCVQLGLVKSAISSQLETRVYQLLNLINTGTVFSDILYTFGRYYLHKFGCAIDFNITLGADLQLIYQEMIECVKRPAQQNILFQIQAVHQKMYVVFYNCYFHKYLKNYVPKWVNTDVQFKTPTKETQKSKHNKKLSHGDIDRSTASSKYVSSDSFFSNLGQSCVILNPHKEQEFENIEEQEKIIDKAGLQLLLSMQRVVEMFNE